MCERYSKIFLHLWFIQFVFINLDIDLLTQQIYIKHLVYIRLSVRARAAVVLIRADFLPRRHWAVSEDGPLSSHRGWCATGIEWVETRDDAKRPTVHRTALTPRHFLAQNVNIAAVEKHWAGGFRYPR